MWEKTARRFLVEKPEEKRQPVTLDVEGRIIL
jgi:hypothetical protein